MFHSARSYAVNPIQSRGLSYDTAKALHSPFQRSMPLLKIANFCLDSAEYLSAYYITACSFTFLSCLLIHFCLSSSFIYNFELLSVFTFTTCPSKLSVSICLLSMPIICSYSISLNKSLRIT